MSVNVTLKRDRDQPRPVWTGASDTDTVAGPGTGT